MKYFVSILLISVALVRATGATFSESFSDEPTKWEVWNPGAFAWDEEAGHLKVTWDSRATNSFFYYKLPFALTRADAFAVEFNLKLDDLMLGVDPTKPYTFPICIGFLNLAEATRTNFFRGSGVNATTGARSIAEFNYFPDSGFGATVGMALVSTNNQFAYSHTFPLELTLGDLFRVKMSFDPAAQMMTMELFRNGEPYGKEPDNTIEPVRYPAASGDFRLDAFSVMTYSDVGQFPPQFAGSLLAHGIVDDVVITWPDAPMIDARGNFVEGQWSVEFMATGGWLYFLERTTDFNDWERLSSVAGAGERTELRDAEAPLEIAFYRVVAQRL